MVLIVTMSPKLLLGWSMLTMSFAGVAPDWWCVSDEEGRSRRDNATFEVCESNSSQACHRVYSHDIKTVINEWDLVCDNAWIKPAIVSIQMAGVLIGAFVGGQSADVVGRKYTLFISLLIHAVANVVAAFSVSWEMFAALRFVLGATIGSVLVTSYTYPMEFIGIKERSVCSTIPNWPFGVSLFALSAWRLENWSHLHLICAAMHIPFLAGFVIVPESFRWLAVKGRIDEAEHVIKSMCSMNKTLVPDNCREKLTALANAEIQAKESAKKYTYIDIVRGWKMAKMTLAFNFIWCSMSIIYYGLLFGVDKFSGNIYLNIFLLACVDSPGIVCIMFVTNRLGRKKTCAILYGLGVVCSLGVIITNYAINAESKGTIINVFAVMSMFCASVAWSCCQILCSESYPTVIRNLGYGAANASARVGGIISPYLLANASDIGVPFIVVGVLFLFCTIAILMLRETNGIPLEDTMIDFDSSDYKEPHQSEILENGKSDNECPEKYKIANDFAEDHFTNIQHVDEEVLSTESKDGGSDFQDVDLTTQTEYETLHDNLSTPADTELSSTHL